MAGQASYQLRVESVHQVIVNGKPAMKQQHCCQMAGFLQQFLNADLRILRYRMRLLRLTGVHDALRDPRVFNAISTCTVIYSASA
jgi:hypothetical protein